MAGIGRVSMLLLILMGALLTRAAAAPQPDAVSIWSIAGATVDGVPVAEYRPAGTASVVHPATLTFVVPPDARWREDVPWFLESDLSVENAVLTATRGDGRTASVRFGMLVPFADRSVKRGLPTIVIPPEVAPNAPLTLTITSDTDHPRLTFLSERALVAREGALRSGLTFPLLLMCGLLLSLALVSLVVYASSRDRAHIYYAGGMFFAAVMTLRSSPDLFWGWVFPHLSAPFMVVDLVTALAYAAFILAFSRSFLKTRKLFPRYDVAMVAGFFIFNTALVVLLLFYTSTGSGIADIVGLLFVGLILVAGILAARKGVESANYYLIAFSGVVVGLVVYDISKLYGYAFWLSAFVGMCWEGLWLTAALADRVKRLRAAREREQLQRLADREYAAVHDALTGLYNRRQIENELGNLAADRDGSLESALLYIDIDHFKVINDTCGHVAGDRLLVAISEALLAAIGRNDTLARIGGDQFTIIARDRSEADIRAFAESIRDTIARQQFAEGRDRFAISASIGCAIMRDSLTGFALLSLADAACSRAKDEGRNTVHIVSDEGSAAKARSEMTWVGRIGEALAEDRFRLYCQSIVPLQNARHRGMHVELLVRMIGEDGSIIEPSHFIPAAERYNLMAQIDRWVIETALPAMQPLVARNEVEMFSINLSGSTLLDEDLAQFITRAIANSRIDPSAICFEITETVVASALGKLTALTKTLRGLGVRFALDDFGTGTSSLALLKRLEIDYLKIDGSFVRDCATNPVDAAMVESIHRLCTLLGLETIAEFASTEAVVERLRAIGVNYAQGWAFSRARPVGEIVGAISA